MREGTRGARAVGRRGVLCGRDGNCVYRRVGKEREEEEEERKKDLEKREEASPEEVGRAAA